MVVGLQQVQGSVSQQGWLKDHRGLCHDKGTAGGFGVGVTTCCVTSWDSWGQANREKVTLEFFRSKPNTLDQESQQCWRGQCLGICDPLLSEMGFSWFLLAE